MSLRVWLPLNGDLRNNGITTCEVTTNYASFTNAGKIGASGENGLFILSSPDFATIFNSDTFTITFWGKLLAIPTATSVSGTYCFDCGVGGTRTQLHFAVRPTSGAMAFCFYSDDYTFINSGTDYVNVWHHFTLMYDHSYQKVYLDGTLLGQRHTSGNLNIAENSSFRAYNQMFVLNDLRIYDHALSEKEIKKISQGLILHYPLNRNGFGQENLIKNSHTKLDNAGYYVGTYAFANPSELVTGEKYTFSFSGELQDETQTGWYFNIFPSPYPHIGSISTTEDGRYSFTFTMPENGGNRTSIGCYSTPLGNRKGCAIWDVKLEKGEVATPWCPNSADTIYTTLGLDDNIEYDMSGFGNNGTRFNTFDWDSNAPKYNISTIFNGNNNAIQTPDLTTMITDKNYTISCWFYKTVIGAKGYQTIYGGPSGFELEARNAAGTDPQVVAWNWGKPTATYEFNTWNHFAFVHSDDDCKIYLNGVLAGTGTAKASNPSGNYFVGSWSSSTSQNFDGLISDFRIYATALSQADIAELYTIRRS